MGARQQSAIAEIVQIFADGLRGDIKTERQLFDENAALGAGEGDDLLVARGESGHACMFSLFFEISNIALHNGSNIAY